MRILFILDSVENPTSANVLMAQRLAGAFLCCRAHRTPAGTMGRPASPAGAARLHRAPPCLCGRAPDERRAGKRPQRRFAHSGAAGAALLPPHGGAAAFRQLVLHAPRRVVDTRRELEKLDAAFHFEVICAVCAPYRAAFALETAQVQAKKAIWQLDPYASNRDYQPPAATRGSWSC